MSITIEVDSHDAGDEAYGGPAFSDYSIWCYHIHNTDGFKKGDKLGVDLPPDTYVMPPKEAGEVHGFPKYDLDGAGTGPSGKVEKDGQKDVEICFVTKKVAAKRGDLSLEISQPEPSGSHVVYSPWRPLPYDDAPEGSRTHWVPAVAARSPGAGTELATIVSYEADKLRALVAGSPPSRPLLEVPTTGRRLVIMGDRKDKTLG